MRLGLVAAKDNSNRFPGKNKYIVDGFPLFYHSVKLLKESSLIDDVVVATDSEFILEYCKEKNIKTVWRPKNASRDEDKLISILRYAYYSLDQSYHTIVGIMANCPGNKLEDIEKGIILKEENDLKEVRSFDPNGLENGVLILDREILETNRDISYYIGSIQTTGKEIHYKTDLDEN